MNECIGLCINRKLTELSFIDLMYLTLKNIHKGKEKKYLLKEVKTIVHTQIKQSHLWAALRRH